MIDLAPASMGSFGEVTPDILVLGFTLVASGAIAFGFGLLPAWQGRRLDLQANLKEGRRQGGAASVERMRFRRLLVSAFGRRSADIARGRNVFPALELSLTLE